MERIRILMKRFEQFFTRIPLQLPITFSAMNVRHLYLLTVFSFLVSACASKPINTANSPIERAWQKVETAIHAQRQAGHPHYNPAWLYIVDPATQRMHIVSRQTKKIKKTVRCGTGKRGLGFGHAQTPTGFFTMGGVRIAKNGDSSIQTGDTKSGVSGIYAEILYPPTHPDPKLRGRVPNGVVIHSYNPDASEMLRQRRAQRLIGRVPCTTGCPVPDIDEAHKLIPYLKQSAGTFDPTSRPNAKLQSLIRKGLVKQYQRQKLGAAIYILDRR